MGSGAANCLPDLLANLLMVKFTFFTLLAGVVTPPSYGVAEFVLMTFKIPFARLKAKILLLISNLNITRTLLMV